MTEKKTLDVLEIMELIPHRFPMLLLDKLIIKDVGEKAVGIKNVTFNEQFFQGHFPSKPIMPGVFIVEAMAQAAGALVMHSIRESGEDCSKKLVYFMSIDETKFRRPVLPGDVLELHVEKEKMRGNVWRFKGQAIVNNIVTSESMFTAMIAEPHK